MKITKTQKSLFQKALLEFYGQNSLDKPWKTDKDSYKIWVFEVVMQQTRMEQGIPYYEKIIRAFPTVHKLAQASEDELFSLWKGLGYYSRARNLHYTAKYISRDLKGIFPNSYVDLIKLKGIGEYTAAAIASFAFKEDVAVMDGNAHRVLSRIYGIKKTIQNTGDKKYFQDVAIKLLIRGESDLFNQSIMNLGSFVCKPQNPLCEECSMTAICYAYQHEKTKELPPPKIRAQLKKRYFFCIMIVSKGDIYLRKRTENDIWKGLWEGIVQEGDKINHKFWQDHQLDISSLHWGEWHPQVLSHQKIFMKIAILKVDSFVHKDFTAFQMDKIETIAFPRIISKWWEKAT